MASVILTKEHDPNYLDDGDINPTDDLYDFTEDQIQAMLELDLMQRENSEYPNIEVRERLEELNMALANDPTPDDSLRESKVVFKENLVDLIAPAPDYPSEDEEEEEEQRYNNENEAEEDEDEDENEEEKEKKTADADEENATTDDQETESDLNKYISDMKLNAKETARRKEIDREQNEDIESSTLKENGASQPSESSTRSDSQESFVSESSSNAEIKHVEAANDKEKKRSSSKTEDDDDGSAQVLVERNGQYILTNNKAVEAENDSGLSFRVFHHSSKKKKRSFRNRTPHPPASRRPQSAPQRRQKSTPATAEAPRSESASSKSEYSSPYAMTTEMKEARRRRLEQKKQRIKSAEVQRRDDEHDKRENADAAFQAWLRQKREYAREHKRNEDKGSEASSVESQERAEQAMSEWLKRKRKERRQDMELRNRQLEAMYNQQQLHSHSQEEIDKAFRSWLRRKNRAAKLAAQEERHRARITRLAVRQCRKSQALAFALHRDSSLRYVDYYGYRS